MHLFVTPSGACHQSDEIDDIDLEYAEKGDVAIFRHDDGEFLKWNPQTGWETVRQPSEGV